MPDLLTGARLVIAMALIPTVAASHLSEASLLVSIAWVTDFFDGRIARAIGTEGHLGKWDMTVDTVLGACLLAGLAASGSIPVWFALGAVVLFGGLFLAGNLAAAMLLQLAGYLPFLRDLWSERPTFWWLPLAIAVVIGAIDWRRLLTVNIPNFIHGASGRFDGR